MIAHIVAYFGKFDKTILQRANNSPFLHLRLNFWREKEYGYFFGDAYQLLGRVMSKNFVEKTEAEKGFGVLWDEYVAPYLDEFADKYKRCYNLATLVSLPTISLFLFSIYFSISILGLATGSTRPPPPATAPPSEGQ